MEQQLKQRLVGVSVIFSLAIIFLPMLLDGSGNRPHHLKISIPIPPEIDSYERVDDKIKQLKIDVEQLPQFTEFVVDEISDPPDEKKPEPNKIKRKEVVSTAVEAEKEAKPKVKPKVSPPEAVKPKQLVKEVKKLVGGKSWVIQIGSFSEKNKAYLQRDKLRKSGLAAVFIEKFKHDGMLSYRVRMGPFISKEKARVIGNKVRAKYNIKGLVMNYEK